MNQQTLSLKTLHEGLGAVLKNIATGNVEDEIEELEKEAKDIHTPEQQRYVLTKVIRLLENLIVLPISNLSVQIKILKPPIPQL